MSKFKTTLPIQVNELVATLPRGCAVLEIKLREDLRGVDVIWDHDKFHTGFTFPVDCPDPSNPPVKLAPSPLPPETALASSEPAAAVSRQEPDSASQPEQLAEDARPVKAGLRTPIKKRTP